MNYKILLHVDNYVVGTTKCERKNLSLYRNRGTLSTFYAHSCWQSHPTYSHINCQHVNNKSHIHILNHQST